LQLYKHEHQEATALGVDLNAHQATSDVLHVKMLHEYLRDLADDERLEALTQTFVLLPKFTFGKYKGCFIEEIAVKDRNYLEWMLHQAVDIDEDLRFSIKHHLSH
jgi:DNA polymerase-3 subunit epsilon/exodeoxyribonuclease X